MGVGLSLLCICTNMDNLYIETISGNLKCSKHKNDVTVNMGKPKFDWNEIPLISKQNTQKVILDDFEAFCLSMGTLIVNLDCSILTTKKIVLILAISIDSIFTISPTPCFG